MPIPFLAELIFNGIPGGFSYWSVIKGILAITVLVALKWYYQGASNGSERQMHSKIVMITVRHILVGSISINNRSC
jgi:hypothetical protein